jgi:methionyl-tRNA formyltransferase
MKILVLGPTNEELLKILKKNGNEIIEKATSFDLNFIKENQIEFVVSFGYRHIIKHDTVHYLRNRMINLHISYLPWNRGADPNLWSFLENTPKGVSIHLIDEGIDTGEIIAQKTVNFEMENPTLATTYNKLQDEVILLFKENWPCIAQGRFEASKQPIGGSFHKSSDKDRFMHLLTKGWETPIELLRGKALI